MRITNNFLLSEFAQPAKRGCAFEPYPEIWIATRLKPLCAQLEVIRATVKKPLVIVSGYRSDAYNRAIYAEAKQKPTDSQHCYGRAADFYALGLSALELANIVDDLAYRGIIQIGGRGRYTNFCHIDIREQKHPGRVARWDGSRSVKETA